MRQVEPTQPAAAVSAPTAASATTVADREPHRAAPIVRESRSSHDGIFEGARRAVVSLAAAVDEIDATAPAPDVLVPAVASRSVSARRRGGPAGVVRAFSHRSHRVCGRCSARCRDRSGGACAASSTSTGGGRLFSATPQPVSSCDSTGCCSTDVAVHSVTQRKLNEGSAAAPDPAQAVHRCLRVVHRTRARRGPWTRPCASLAATAGSWMN